VRSLLFVPGHDERKLAKGLDSGADALIVDLEDSVPDAEKPRARGVCAEFVAANRERVPLFVRINALATGLAVDDLAAVVRAKPYGIMLPKSESGRDVARVDSHLSELEARDGVPVGSLRVLPIVTETGAAMFELGSYAREAGRRLCGMMWGGEDLATDIGASSNRGDGRYTPPFELARSLCLFGAAAARVPAIDAVYTSPKVRARDTARLACEALGCEPIVHEPLREGFDAGDARELMLAVGEEQRVLVVGHNPDFPQVIYDVTGARIDLKKGGIAAVRMDGTRGELLALLRPRELERICAPAS